MFLRVATEQFQHLVTVVRLGQLGQLRHLVAIVR